MEPDPVIGLWINHIPDVILNNDENLRELSDLILHNHRAQKMVVADRALLITMAEPLPAHLIKNVAQSLKKFLTSQGLHPKEIDAITISTYDDREKWETMKTTITEAVDGKGGLPAAGSPSGGQSVS